MGTFTRLCAKTKSTSTTAGGEYSKFARGRCTPIASTCAKVAMDMTRHAYAREVRPNQDDVPQFAVQVELEAVFGGVLHLKTLQALFVLVDFCKESVTQAR